MVAICKELARIDALLPRNLFGNLLVCERHHKVHAGDIPTIKRRVVAARVSEVDGTVRRQMGGVMIDDKHRTRVRDYWHVNPWLRIAMPGITVVLRLG